MKKLITGNEAVAYGALRAGVKTVTGYPGTPSTGVLTALIPMGLKDTYVEWSTNEKVALEVATGVSWAGHRALCTMKMSGVNVAYDTLISLAYSGIEGGLVIYVADDPGANAGMCEQDSRGFAVLADLPMLEPASVAEAYRLTTFAFELSEAVKTPVFVRLVTGTAHSFAIVEVDEPAPVSAADAVLLRDITRFTKAGSAICLNQHRDLIARLAKAGEVMREHGINPLTLSETPGGVGLLAAGVTAAYLDEAFETLQAHGVRREDFSVLQVKGVYPFPDREAERLLAHCSALVVLEELEPYIEKDLYVLARRLGWTGKIIGKLDGTFSRIGEYGAEQVIAGVAAATGLALPAGEPNAFKAAESLAAARPITTCAGCPHRGTYMAINAALKKLHLKQGEVMVTGDIGCTILGMNPPFNTVWTEISMGSSISLAQGYVHAGVKTPVLATIGDSTFFHAGIPALVNAVQHGVDMTLVVMDNRWTAMTGMQVNPGTPGMNQAGKELDLEKVIPALGVDQFFVMDPFDLSASTDTVVKALGLPGVKVILSRRECAIQSRRKEKETMQLRVIEQNCNLCKLCVMVTGCSALSLGDKAIVVDAALCHACGLCVQTCNRDALALEEKA